MSISVEEPIALWRTVYGFAVAILIILVPDKPWAEVLAAISALLIWGALWCWEFWDEQKRIFKVVERIKSHEESRSIIQQAVRDPNTLRDRLAKNFRGKDIDDTIEWLNNQTEKDRRKHLT